VAKYEYSADRFVAINLPKSLEKALFKAAPWFLASLQSARVIGS
jgi:hypothetical protein